MSSSKKSINIVASNLNEVGGFEKIVSKTANLFASKGHEVTLLLLAPTDKSFFYLDPRIRVQNIDVNFGISEHGNILSRKIRLIKDSIFFIRTLRKINHSILISSEYHYSVLSTWYKMLSKKKLLSWEHTHYNASEKNKFWHLLFISFYKRIDRVVCLNNSEKMLFRGVNNTVSVVPNFIEATAKISNQRSNRITTVARLVQIKGIDHLLKVAARVLKMNQDWRWYIVGEGELKAVVQQFILTNKLNNLILVPPKNDDLSNLYEKSSIYVMTSRFECFPMVLLEAMSHGVPCIAFDCPTGPAHIITDGEDGILIEPGNVEAMADAITDLIRNEEKRKEMGIAGQKNIQRFSPDAVYALWEDIFNAE